MAGKDEYSNQTRRPKLLLHGLDTLEVAFYLDVRRSKLDFIELEAEQQRAKETARDSFVEIALGTETFALAAYGRFPYRYVLSNEEFEVRLAEFMRPACLVRFSSKGLWTFGVKALVERFKAWCQSMSLTAPRGEVVSRADWAFDYPLPAVDFELHHFVTLAAKDSVWREHGAVQTFQIGRDQVVVRVYDKVAEIGQSSGKTFLFELWDRDSEVWRIEFQIRGERLKEGGIRTLDDLASLQNDLLRQLAGNHTTLRRPTGNTNRSRWPLHPLWQAVQDDISTLPQTGLIRHIDPKAPIKDRLYHQAKSIHGHLKGFTTLLVAIGALGPNPRLEDVLARLQGHLEPHHQADIWASDIQNRLTALRLGRW